MKHLSFFPFLIIVCLLSSCSNELPDDPNIIKDSINVLQVFRDGILKESYHYTDSFKLLKEIQYDNSGNFFAKFFYSYSEDTISKVIVTYLVGTDSATYHIDYSYRNYPDPHPLAKYFSNFIDLRLTSYYGPRGNVPDFPHEFAPVFEKVEAVSEFTLGYGDIAYYGGTGIKLPAIYAGTKQPYYNFRVTLIFDQESHNVQAVRNEWDVQIPKHNKYEYDTNKNIFFKFGTIKFNAKWLSQNNIVRAQRYNSSIFEYQYASFDSKGYPLTIIETSSDSNKPVIYHYTYSKQ